MKVCRHRHLARAVLAGVTAAGIALVVAPAARVAAQASVATKTFANERYHYAVALPAGCRHEEGPGTVDAVCAADFDPERSAQASSATALVMEVGAEIVADDAGRTATDLAQRYDEAAFREEMPQAVCGESDKSRARTNNVKQSVEETRVVYTADVICAEVRFLQIAERRASVRYLIAPDARYRLVARAPIEEFEKQKPAIEAFFESFRMLPAGKQNQ
jgi:predicted DCC family thiol-disulfide oxidoreductase YuxK